MTDGKNQTTAWKYDIYGRLTNKLDHLGSDMFRYTYNTNGWLLSRWAPQGSITTSYAYDPVGNLTNVLYPSNPDLTLEYDSMNRLVKLVDGQNTNRYSYDRLGQMLTEDGPWDGDTVSHTYNHRLRASMSVPQPGSSAWSQAFGYDAAQRLKTVGTSPGEFTYSYHSGLEGATASSRLVQKIALPNTAYITNDFESPGRLIDTMLKSSSGAPLGWNFYSYNDGNQRTLHGRIDPIYAEYTYDPAGQLLTAKGYDWGHSLNVMHEQFSYAYDAAGNLSCRTNNALVQTFSVNSLNQLSNATHSGTLTVAGTFTAVPTNVYVNANQAIRYSDNTFSRTNLSLVDGTNTFLAEAYDSAGRYATDTVNAFLPATVNFTYDLNGNLLSDGVRHLSWDDENQLVQVVVTNSTKSEFSYDGRMRRRVRKEYVWQNGAWHPTAEVRYVYDGNVVLQERHYDPRFSLSRAQRVVTYTRGLDLSATLQGAGGIGGLLARTEFIPATQTSSTAYYHADGNGNITSMVDSNQIVVARYVYDPFGGLLAKSGPLADANLYRFSSKEWHEPSGLVYYLYRYYDPSLQRWPNRDPIGELGGLNLYGFNYNLPTMYLDKDGRATVLIGAGIGLTFGIGRQLWQHGLNWRGYDLYDIGASTVVGALGWGAISNIRRILTELGTIPAIEESLLAFPTQYLKDKAKDEIRRQAVNAVTKCVAGLAILKTGSYVDYSVADAMEDLSQWHAGRWRDHLGD